MTNSNPRKRQKQIAIIVVLLALGFLAVRILSNEIGKRTLGDEYHETSATVTKKEIVNFDEKNNSFVNDQGEVVKAKPGNKQYRVYFYFDDFDGYNNSFRDQLMQAEKKRISESRPHFTWGNYNDPSLYDTVDVGDKLIVTYKAYSDGVLDILSAEKSKK